MCIRDRLGPAALGVKEGIVDLEAVAAGSGIEACYLKLTGKALSGAEISQAANDGEDDALSIIRQAGYALGVSLAGWTNMLDPDLIILSGSVAKAGRIWRDEVSRGFLERIPDVLSQLPIVDAELGGDAPLIGATEFLLDTLAAKR